MYSYRTAYWPQTAPYLVRFRKSARQPQNLPVSEPHTAGHDNSPKTNMQIVQDVRSELGREPSVRAAAIDIHANDGVVALSGIVDSDGERWLIETAARRVAGVNKVLVQLKVFGANENLTDDEIAHDCERVLDGLTPESDYSIGVMVASGWVTLSGYVAEGYERSVVETEIRSLLSVRGISSQVRARPSRKAKSGGAGNTPPGHHQNELKSGSYEFVRSYDGMTWSDLRNSWAVCHAQLHKAWSSSRVKRLTGRIRPS